jgi:putative flippase GtrA
VLFKGVAVKMKLFAKFFLVGGFATCLQYILMIVFIELFWVPEVLASALAYAISAIANYLANYHLTFKSQQKHILAFSKFIFVASFALAINTLLFFLVFSIGVHYLLAQIVATLVTLIINFLAHKFWIYGKAS